MNDDEWKMMDDGRGRNEKEGGWRWEMDWWRWGSTAPTSTLYYTPLPSAKKLFFRLNIIHQSRQNSSDIYSTIQYIRSPQQNPFVHPSISTHQHLSTLSCNALQCNALQCRTSSGTFHSIHRKIETEIEIEIEQSLSLIYTYTVNMMTSLPIVSCFWVP